MWCQCDSRAFVGVNQGKTKIGHDLSMGAQVGIRVEGGRAESREPDWVRLHEA